MSEKEFDQSLRSVKKMLFNYALKLTKDQDDANDLLQDTSLRAFRYREKFKVGTNFKAWIFIIMRNIFLNNYHKKKAQADTLSIHDYEFLTSSSGNGARNDAISNIRLEEIDNCLDVIDDKYKDALLMYSRGFKYQEIAERFIIPLGTVKNRIHVAREKLMGNIKRIDSEMQYCN